MIRNYSLIRSDSVLLRSPGFSLLSLTVPGRYILCKNGELFKLYRLDIKSILNYIKLALTQPFSFMEMRVSRGLHFQKGDIKEKWKTDI